MNDSVHPIIYRYRAALAARNVNFLFKAISSKLFFTKKIHASFHVYGHFQDKLCFGIFLQIVGIARDPQDNENPV